MKTWQVLSRRGFLCESAAIGTAALAGAMPATASSEAMARTATQEGPWQLGCYTRPWSNHDYRTALDAIAGNILYYSDGKVNPVEDAASVDGLVTGWCVKDYRQPKQVDVTPGSGQVDFPAVFRRLKKGGFTHGGLVVETLTPGEPRQLLAEARKARQFLETLVGG